MSSCGPGPAGIRNVPKRDSLLLLAKLYLIQWVFPCTVASPGVINCNISSHVSTAACVSSLCWPADATTLFSDHDDAGKLRAPCLHPFPGPLAVPGWDSGARVALVLFVFVCLFTNTLLEVGRFSQGHRGSDVHLRVAKLKAPSPQQLTKLQCSQHSLTRGHGHTEAPPEPRPASQTPWTAPLTPLREQRPPRRASGNSCTCLFNLTAFRLLCRPLRGGDT